MLRKGTGTDDMKHVVMVEDDPMVANAFLRVLSRKGYDVNHFIRVEQARSYLRGRNPDILLLDREVWGEDGWSLRHEVDAKVTKVILMTGAPPEGNTLPFFHKGQDDLHTLLRLLEG